MGNRARISLGKALGLFWGVALIWIGTVHVNIPIFSFVWALALAFLFPGLVLAAIVGRIAHRGQFEGPSADGAPVAPGKGAEIDARVLQDSIAQSVMALLIWPAAGLLLAVDGPGAVLCLGLGFAIARICFWIGHHRSPTLRAFGFAATFYPTLLVAGWAVLWWLL